MDAEDEDLQDAKRLRDRVAVPAFRPVFSPDDAIDASKVGGTPWLDREWPRCSVCTQPLRFLLQLRRDQVPETCRWAFREDLLQLFLCDAVGKPGVPGWQCQAHGRGWEAFAPSTFVRHLSLSGARLDPMIAFPQEARIEMARFEHLAQDEYRSSAGDPPLPPPTSSDLAARAEELRIAPADSTAFRLQRTWLYPAQRISDWSEFLDVPGYGDIDLDEKSLLETALGLVCFHGEKLAGTPSWAQNPRVPSCRACRSPMTHLFQIQTNGPIQIGGDGIGWLFVCRTCQDGTFTWQR